MNSSVRSGIVLLVFAIANGLTPQSAISLINKCRSTEAAVAVLNEMHHSGIGLHQHAYTSAVKCCGRHGDWRIALSLANRVNDQDNVLTHAVLGALARNYRGREAEAIITKVRKSGALLDKVSINTALKACRYDWNRSVKILREATEWCHVSESVEGPDVMSYRAAIRACIEADEFHQAKLLLDEARINLPAGKAQVISTQSSSQAAKIMRTDKKKRKHAYRRQMKKSWSQKQQQQQQQQQFSDSSLIEERESDTNELRDAMEATAEVNIAVVDEVTSTLDSLEWSLWHRFSNHRLEEMVGILKDKLLPGAMDRKELNRIKEETKLLNLELGLAADYGKKPSFESSQARIGYTLEKLTSRSARVGDYLILADPLFLEREQRCGSTSGNSGNNNEPRPPQWVHGALAKLLLKTRSSNEVCCKITENVENKWKINEERGPCRLISLGGGPAFDVAALQMLQNYLALGHTRNRFSRTIDALVLDYEAGWEECALAVAHAAGAQNSFAFATTNINLPLHHHANRAVEAALRHSNHGILVVASYVVAENAEALRKSGFVFFRDMVAEAPIGSLFLLTETTHRVWPDFIKSLFDKEDDVADMLCREAANMNNQPTLWTLDMAFVSSERKRGFGLCIQKRLSGKKQGSIHARASAVGAIKKKHEALWTRVHNQRSQNLLRLFQRHDDMHQRRLAAEEARLKADRAREAA